MTSNNNKKSTLKVKLLIWLGLIVIVANLTSYIPNLLINDSWIISFVYVIIIIISVIFTLYYLVKNFYLTKKHSIILAMVVIFVVIFPYIPSIGNIVPIPDLVGKNQSYAENILQENGLKSNISYVASDESYNGKVINQSPVNGILVYKQKEVNIAIGKGVLPSIIISNPLNNSFAKNVTPIRGTFSNLGNDDKIYVLVQPQPRYQNGVSIDGPYEWYVQPKPAMEYNTWITNLYLGQSGDSENGRNFIVVVIVTKETLKYNAVYGFKLPSNYEFIQEITLTRY
jgi:hypothetical protein